VQSAKFQADVNEGTPHLLACWTHGTCRVRQSQFTGIPRKMPEGKVICWGDTQFHFWTSRVGWPGGKVMTTLLAIVAVLCGTVAQGADDAPKASGIRDGKRITFPAKGIADGAKAAVSLLESCHDEGLYQDNERKLAEQGDHIRLVFAKPIPVTIMGKKIEMSELIFRLPSNTGVFWVRDGDTWRRYAKYEFQKEKPFTTWLREARSED
jgi:hypothetical protein